MFIQIRNATPQILRVEPRPPVNALRTLVQRLRVKYMKPFLEPIETSQIDPSYITSHRISLDKAPEMCKVWRDQMEQVTTIVIDPWAT